MIKCSSRNSMKFNPNFIVSNKVFLFLKYISLYMYKNNHLFIFIIYRWLGNKYKIYKDEL